MRIQPFLVSSLLILIGCSQEESGPRSGVELFNSYCAACHGPEGRGKFLRGIPANILTHKSPVELSQLIRRGQSHPEATMPNFPQLSVAEADRITQYLLKLQDDFVQSGGNIRMLVPPSER